MSYTLLAKRFFTCTVLAVFCLLLHGVAPLNRAVTEKLSDQDYGLPSLDAPRGGLVIAGGGTLVPEITRTFLRLTGKDEPALLVIPTASKVHSVDEEAKEIARWQARGAGSVQFLHVTSRDYSFKPEIYDRIDQVDAIWISGGDQSILSERYVDTPVEAALKRALAGGKVIGGTSAGAAVMSKIMIAGGNHKPIPGEGFGLLPGAIVDQHFLRRRRETRLVAMLGQHPECWGVGVCERTALVVTFEDRMLRVIGDAHVVLYLPPVDGRRERLKRSASSAPLSLP